jgi:hypothetical protein
VVDRLRRLLSPLALTVLRLAWLAVPLTVGASVEEALGDNGTVARWLIGAELWVAWLVGLVALMVLHPVTLTIIRTLAPAAAGVALAASLAGDVDPLALGVGFVVGVIAFAASIGEAYVDAPSYGTERRLPLRPPVPLLMLPVPFAWLMVAAGLSVGPLLLAAELWVAGGIATAVGLVLAFIGVRALHGLARRWIVFVPAGIVLHDPMTTLDPFLCRQQTINRLGALRAGDSMEGEGTLDATQRASGIVLEARLDDPVQVIPARPRDIEVLTVDRVLFCPTRPGRMLDEAEHRQMAVA